MNAQRSQPRPFWHVCRQVRSSAGLGSGSLPNRGSVVAVTTFFAHLPTYLEPQTTVTERTYLPIRRAKQRIVANFCSFGAAGEFFLSDEVLFRQNLKNLSREKAESVAKQLTNCTLQFIGIEIRSKLQFQNGGRG